LYYVNKEQVPFDQLEQVLFEKTLANNDKTVVVRVPAENKVQDLVDLMQMGVKLKLNFVIATAK
jgi:biopolymer transport protein ExbD